MNLPAASSGVQNNVGNDPCVVPFDGVKQSWQRRGGIVPRFIMNLPTASSGVQNNVGNGPCVVPFDGKAVKYCTPVHNKIFVNLTLKQKVETTNTF